MLFEILQCARSNTVHNGKQYSGSELMQRIDSLGEATDHSLVSSATVWQGAEQVLVQGALWTHKRTAHSAKNDLRAGSQSCKSVIGNVG